MTESHKVGDRVWVAAYTQHAQLRETCPVCFGKLEVVVILGNGDSVTTPCSYCTRGHEGPFGFVNEYGPQADAKFMTITAIRSTEDGSGQHHEYHSGTANSYRVLTPDLMFATESEAIAKGEELAAKAVADRDERAVYLKEKAHKSFAWNAGYHMRAAKRAREEAERHERQAVICKARGKGGES